MRADRSQRRFEAFFAPLGLHQLDLGAGQFAVGANNVITATGLLQFVAFDTRLGYRRAFEQDIVDAGFKGAFVHTRSHGGIALWVQVDQQHALADLSQTRSQVDRGGGLANAAFLVGDTEDFGHADVAPTLHRCAGRCPPKNCRLLGLDLLFFIWTPLT